MRATKSLLFFGQSVVLGLAIAFVAVSIWPNLLPARVVELRSAAAATTPVQPGPVTYAPAVVRAAPAVVNVNTARVVTLQPNPFFQDPFFRQFFGDGFDRPRRELEASLGSGVIVSSDGYILTNNHVINGADEIQVSLHDGRTVSAKVVGADPESDIAVLKVNLTHLPVITFGHSEKLQVGDVVLAIGNPFGVGQTVTMGIVSATGRNRLGLNTFENFIQTDAAINPGNSGGALIDARGNLVGINTAIYSRSGGYQGIGFAIPTSLAKQVMEQIIKYGHAVRGWLGIEAQTITPELAKAFRLTRDQGVIVAGVSKGGPGAKAGLQPGDVITAINGEKIKDGHQVLMVVSGAKPGSSVRLDVVRHGKPIMLNAVVGDRPPVRVAPGGPVS